MDIFNTIPCNSDSLCDILDSILEPDLLKGVQESDMEIGNGCLVLYTALNRDNTEKLQNGKYSANLTAFEYKEQAMGQSQAQFVIKLAYNPKGLFDTLHPKAYSEVKKAILKTAKLADLTDTKAISWILTNMDCTGVRVHILNSSKKCYPQTKCLFESSKVVYCLKPQHVTVLGTEKIPNT